MQNIVVIDVEDKYELEKVSYTLDFGRFTAFALGLDRITSVAFHVYAKSDTLFANDLTAMVGPMANTIDTATCRIGSGSDTKGSYVMRCLATCSVTGDIYEQRATFNVI